MEAIGIVDMPLSETSINYINPIIEYVTFVSTTIIIFGVLIYQKVLHHLILTGKSDKIDFVVLPTYGAVTFIHGILCIIGIVILSIGLPIDVTDAITNIIHLVISFIPLILVHLKTLPSLVLLYVLYAGVVIIFSGIGWLDFKLEAPEWTYAVVPTYVLIILGFIGLLFRKHFRINKNPSIIVHTCLASIYVLLVLAYGITLKVYDYPIDRALLVSKVLFIFITISGFFVKYRDTKIWRGLVRSDAMQQLESDIQEPLNVTNMNIQEFNELIEDYSHSSIDFSYVKIKRRIAVGGRSTVYLGKYKENDVIIKVLRPPEITPDIIRHWHREISICMRNNHENIVKAYGVVIVPPRVMLVFEYCKRSLTEYLELVEIKITFGLSLMLDIISGVEYLHRQHIIHRDLKIDNIIMCHCGCLVAKLIDFGESRVQTAGPMTIIGTPYYMAPEILNMEDGRSYYDKSVDIFSLAIIFWKILYNGRDTHPADWSIANVLTSVRHGFRPAIDSDVRNRIPELVDLIERMWHEDPPSRPNAREVKSIIEDLFKHRLSDMVAIGPLDKNEAIDVLMREGHCSRRTEAKKLLKYAKKYDILNFD